MKLNVALYAALRAAAWLLPLLPLRLAYWLANGAGTCAYYLFARPRQGIVANLSVVLGASPASPRVRMLARRAFRQDALNWVDTLRISRLTRRDILNAVPVNGWEHVEAAAAQGRGVIIVCLHLGNFDLVGQVLGARGFNATVPVERMQPERLFRFLLRARASQGIHPVAVERAPREMLRTLRRGDIVAIAGDRNVVGRGIVVPFFGRPAIIPRGPIALAYHSKAPLLLGYGVRTREKTFQGYASQPLPLCGDEDLDARMLVTRMEEVIARYPDQWLVFSPVWSEMSPCQEAATIERPTKAAV